MYMMNFEALIFTITIGIVVTLGIASCFHLIKTKRLTWYNLTGTLLLSAILGWVVWGIFCPCHNYESNTCLNNIKQLSLGVMMYADDYDGSYPNPKKWNEQIFPYTKSSKLLYCPQAHRRDMPAYALNSKLKGMNSGASTHVDTTVMIFESIPGRNLAGGSELLPKYPRHHGGDHIGFLDDHAKWLSSQDALRLTTHGRPGDSWR